MVKLVASLVLVTSGLCAGLQLRRARERVRDPRVVAVAVAALVLAAPANVEYVARATSALEERGAPTFETNIFPLRLVGLAGLAAILAITPAPERCAARCWPPSTG